MKIIKRASRPLIDGAIEQAPGSGIWFVPAATSGTTATRAQVEAVCVPHPEGGGRIMLRQVPAGVALIEVVAGKIASAGKPEAAPEEKTNGSLR